MTTSARCSHPSSRSDSPFPCWQLIHRRRTRRLRNSIYFFSMRA
jgi:hypothetical protein